ncbi:hypothetical protein [Enterococcus cecorum]|uniref:hypothetical protein n=1 Tax=Enterococcus cecorum TaxID=44008 RepID=UPI00148D9E13|nr:hypothetical protein [Enterococcus cecorum]
MKSSKYYYSQLMTLSSKIGNIIDPFADLGAFDNRTMTFFDEVEDLISTKTNKPYNFFMQEKIKEMRKVYLEYQKALIKELQKDERKSYAETEVEKERIKQEITFLLSLGFNSIQVAKMSGYSESVIRNNYRQSDYNQMNVPTYFSKATVSLQPDLFFFPESVEKEKERGRSILDRASNLKKWQEGDNSWQPNKERQFHQLSLF